MKVLDAFATEAVALADALGQLGRPSWHRPTRCPPWNVRELFAHVHVVTARVPQMIAASSA